MARKKHILALITIIFFVSFLLFFQIIQHDTALAEKGSTKVYLGGNPIGVVARADGVVVTDYVDVMTESGVRCPAKEAGLNVGDIIKQLNSQKINGLSDIRNILKYNYDSKSASMEINIERNGSNLQLSIKPCVDISLNEYKLGIMAKDDISGVGTITYIIPSNNRFGGLGHRIYDNKMPKLHVYNKGNIYGCAIIGVVKGSNSKAGELRGHINKKNNMGILEKNNEYGIFGYINASNQKYPLVELGNRKSVRPGKAYIYTSIDGDTPEKYEIEIIKAIPQENPAAKGLVIRITDGELVNKSGGIVQGMSGSPIVQNGKLVGAVTHVFINDPTKGYGVYIDWMINN
ncbi:MAG: SpoIVB peptidase [Christensenellales bacterium]